MYWTWLGCLALERTQNRNFFFFFLNHEVVGSASCLYFRKSDLFLNMTLSLPFYFLHLKIYKCVYQMSLNDISWLLSMVVIPAASVFICLTRGKEVELSSKTGGNLSP